jgi:excisionase family DNA binding protein
MSSQPTERRRLIPPAGDSLADDLLFGAQAIADYLGITQGQAYHWLAQGYIPFTKTGDLYIGSKARLRRHFAGDASTGEGASHG